MEKKYELVEEDSIWSIKHVVAGYAGKISCRLYRIRALRDFGGVKEGDLGGYVQSESNLSHDGDCWIYDDAFIRVEVFGEIEICGDQHYTRKDVLYPASEYDADGNDIRFETFRGRSRNNT